MARSDFLREQAERCRRLARETLDHEFKAKLLEIAEEFDREAEEALRSETAEH